MLSYRLASGISDPAIAWMTNATQIIQFPLGLVVAAVSIAILPTLSQQAEAKAGGLFRATLARGLRLVLFLVIPATVGLYVLATPVVRLVFERGAFAPADTLTTAEVLRYSLLGLLSAAVDQPLIFAFYARKNTLAPALVGVGTTLLYVLVAVGVQESGLLTLPVLVLLNALKLAAHALTMLILTRRHLGGLGDHGLYGLALRAVLASAVMLPLTWVTMRYLTAAVPSGWLGGVITVGGAGAVGAAVYVLAAAAMGIKEIELLRAAVRRGLDRLTVGSR
jgi:putative peptidoglycan lipid II flippase